MEETQYSTDSGQTYSSISIIGEITSNDVFTMGGFLVTNVILGTKVTSIGNNAFQNCSSLTTVTIPNSVTSIGNNAFRDCSRLTTVTIPNSVTSIGIVAFASCHNLTTIDIPNSVTSIGDYAFNSCSRLTTVTISNRVTSIGDGMFAYCSSLTTVTIPNSVTSIGYSAFRSCSRLTTIAIPNSVTYIGNYAFASCSSLTTVAIPNSVTSIGYYVFDSCSNLANMTFESPLTLSTINNTIFLSIPSNSTRRFYFNNTDNESQINATLLASIRTITDRDTVSTTGPQIFIPPTQYSTDGGITYRSVLIEGEIAYSNVSNMGGPNLTNVILGFGVTSIGNYAFDSCSSLTTVTIPNSVTSIGNSAFYQCSMLTTVTIPNSVTSIGDGAFAFCSSLTTVTIPNSLTSIGNNAFQSCSSLTTVTIPNSVTSIGDYAFAYCSSLANMTFESPLTSSAISNTIFSFIQSNSTRTFYFNNTNESQINANLLDGIRSITDRDTVSTTGPQIFIDTVTTVITVNSFDKTYGDVPFDLNPSSNSSAPFSYSSDNAQVATVDNTGLVTLVGVGNAVITVSQPEISGYTSGTANSSIVVNPATPTITNFNIPTKTYGDIPFSITNPSSNSSGAFSYTSSNVSVATIAGNIVTIVGSGSATITATQAATSNYTSGTITTSFQVNASTPTNPVSITDGPDLEYWLTTNASYASLTTDITVADNLTNDGNILKNITNSTTQPIDIVK